ncbi:MAG: hypothetical protein J6M59_10770 [Bacteroidaceae bacterium]|nr:hypothetical protein [Bacteroidaceae bacterium]
MKTRKDYLPEIKRRCEEHEVDFDRLAKKDIDEIIGEIKAEENGDAILDGWFFTNSFNMKYKKGTD